MRRRLTESDMVASMAGGRRGRAGDKYAATSHENLTSVSEIAFLRANLQPPRHDRITIANFNGYGPRDQDGPFLSMTNRLSPRFYYFQVNVTQRLFVWTATWRKGTSPRRRDCSLFHAETVALLPDNFAAPWCLVCRSGLLPISELLGAYVIKTVSSQSPLSHLHTQLPHMSEKKGITDSIRYVTCSLLHHLSDFI